MIPRPPESKRIGLFPCGHCTYCERGYIIPSTGFTIKTRNRTTEWQYTRYFDCTSKNVLYVLKTDYDDKPYLGKTQLAKQRVAKHISDVLHPENSNCKD